MNWLNRLEAKFGRYAIQNLPIYIVVMYAIGAILNIFSGGSFYFQYLSLNPYMILHGQVWRLFTFLFAAPGTSIIFLAFVLLFYYSICRSLTYIWGAFRFNMYFLCGVLASIVAAFIVYAINRDTMIFMDTTYLNLSMFLAYAAIFPNAQVYLYGILPLRIKWLAYFDVAVLAYGFFGGDMGSRIEIIVSLLNFVLFYFSTRNYQRISPQQIRRRRNYQSNVKQAEKSNKHKCAICGRTEEDDPNLEFRYCSKCNGEFEYCNDHLFTHTHVK